ncbi:hypothetical protein D3C81_1084940 [compost metagenome]
MIGGEPGVPPFAVVDVDQLVPHQVLGAFDGADAGEEVRRAHREYVRVQQRSVAVGVLPGHAVDDAEVGALAVHLGEGRVGFDGDLHARALLAQRLQARHQPALGEGRHHHDLQPARGTTRHQVVGRVGDLLQGCGYLRVVALPGGRQRHSARGALQQLHAEPVFQQLHMAADGRLGDMQHAGGCDVAAQARGGLEGAYGVQRGKAVGGHESGASPSAIKLFNSQCKKIELFAQPYFPEYPPSSTTTSRAVHRPTAAFRFALVLP